MLQKKRENHETLTLFLANAVSVPDLVVGSVFVWHCGVLSEPSGPTCLLVKNSFFVTVLPRVFCISISVTFVNPDFSCLWIEDSYLTVFSIAIAFAIIRIKVNADIAFCTNIDAIRKSHVLDVVGKGMAYDSIVN